MAKRVAVLTVMHPAGIEGGAERFYRGLAAALSARPGVQAERIDVVVDESRFETIEEGYLRFYDLDVSGFDGVISTKAPAYAVRHENHVCYLQHTMRVFYDMFDREFPQPSDEILRQRALIHRLDSAAFAYPRTRKVFTIGHEVRRRLLQYNQVDSEVLYQGLSLEGLRPGRYEYAFVPGRLHRWKRVDLVIRAMRFVRGPLRLVISGDGEDEQALRGLARGDERIEFRGRVSEEELLALYADALVVPFVPEREDYGLVTVEAFRARKPVITCWDSGEPARIVKNGETGFVCEADPKALAQKLQYLHDHPAEAQRMGTLGERWLQGVRWETVAARLLEALGLN